MKKPGAAIPRNPADAFTFSEPGLSPSRRTSVMAQLFSSIHELTGALTQSAVGFVCGGLVLLRPVVASAGVLTPDVIEPIVPATCPAVVVVFN